MVLFLALWGAVYYILITFTNSNVPVLDSFVNSLSIIGLWALAKKYLEQWWIWFVADIELSALYFYKGIPFTAALYALYALIAIAGYFKWKRMMLTTVQTSKELNIVPTMVTNYGWFTVSQGKTTFAAFPKQQVSIFQIGCKRIESKGLKWNIYPFNELWQGTLNEAVGNSFTIDSDSAYLVYQTHKPKE